MSAIALGGLLGLTAAVGLVLVTGRLAAVRRVSLDARVVPLLRDLPGFDRPGAATGPLPAVLGPAIGALADRLDRLLGGAATIRRRIERGGLDLTVAQFRLQQAVWGCVAFAAVGGLTVLVSLRSPERAVPMLVLTFVAAALGVMLRENRLTAEVRRHEEQVVAELPAVAELLALAVAAGEGPVAALERVVTRSRGALSRDLGRVLAEIRTGLAVATALDGYAQRTGLPVVARFATAIAVAVERGTPLADVLHAQAGDVREAQRRALIESGARREVAMMLPVVFLVLPVTVVFAFWPGVVGLSLVAP